MFCRFERDNKPIIICADTIVSINAYESADTPYCYSCISSSGDIYYLTKPEVDELMEAIKFRDQQLNNLISNTDAIIAELDKLNGTSKDIKGNTGTLVTGMNILNGSVDNIESDTSSIKSQTATNGNLLSQIKIICNNIYDWVRNNRTE